MKEIRKRKLVLSFELFALIMSWAFCSAAEPEYPATAEQVVEAFVKSDFDGTANEVVGNVNRRMLYVTWSVYPGADCFPVAKSYEVVKVAEDASNAKVEVIYHQVGTLCGYDSFTEEKTVRAETYDVVRVASTWKVDSPDPAPTISPSTAVKILQVRLSHYAPDKKGKGDRREMRVRNLILKLNKLGGATIR